MEARDLWGVVLAVWLASVLLLGGTGFPAPAVQIYFTVSSLVLIAAGLCRLRHGMPCTSAIIGAVLAALAMMLVFAQLVPLPYEIWRDLPGRDFAVRAFEAIGESPASLPLTLSPLATQNTALSALPPLAAFIAVLSVPRRHFWMLSTAIVGCAVIGGGIGLLQKGQGAASGLFFYHDPGDARYATGTFANRNLFAAQLYASVPFLAAVAMVAGARWHLRPFITALFTLIYIGLLVAVLATVGSRAGTLLAMVSVLLTMLLVFRPSRSGMGVGAGGGILFFLVAIVVMAQASMVGILRLSETDPLSDFRNTIAAVSLKAAEAQFPAGSGFGTFVPVYQLYETPDTIIDPFVNHAHNEWLETAIEGGAPALVLMALFLVWLIYSLVLAMRIAPEDPANAHVRAGGVSIVLLLFHAAVDFPFRTDALTTLAGLCAGLLALASARSMKQLREAGIQRAHDPKLSPATFRPAKEGFSRARAGATGRAAEMNPPDSAR